MQSIYAHVDMIDGNEDLVMIKISICIYNKILWNYMQTKYILIIID
jgi:hypothetical protein